ncbi:MAG: DUF6134 family protein [Thiolinea sp.]
MSFVKQTVLTRFLLSVLLYTGLAGAGTAMARTESWQFRVFLDDKPIGSHQFTVIDQGGRIQVSGNARFNVSFLGFNAYSYQHSNREEWQGQCLSRINASTNDNGDSLSVSGRSGQNGFQVRSGESTETYPACVKSFAYWRLPFMRSPQLLNAQTGELTAVSLRNTGTEKITVAGTEVNAQRYRLTGKDLQINLWYSPAGRWLGLESVLEGGKRLRYELQ